MSPIVGVADPGGRHKGGAGSTVLTCSGVSKPEGSPRD